MISLRLDTDDVATAIRSWVRLVVCANLEWHLKYYYTRPIHDTVIGLLINKLQFGIDIHAQQQV